MGCGRFDAASSLLVPHNMITHSLSCSLCPPLLAANHTAFTDYTAWSQPDVAGRPLAAITAEPSEAQRCVLLVVILHRVCDDGVVCFGVGRAIL